MSRVTKGKRPASGLAEGYLHGYSSDEQKRLYRQARFLQSSVYEHVDFSRQKSILEVGCGVGAQTELLLERFPHLHVQGIDASEAQIQRAREHLSQQILEKRAGFDLGDALHLPYPDNRFDGAFVCWFLEHVKDPVGILSEIRRTLRSGSVIYCTEVMNATFYVHPYSPATLQFWFAFNDHQWNLKGDPFVGGKLANHLLAAGYQNIATEVKVQHFDNRAPKTRADYIQEFTEALLSGAKTLIDAGKVTPDTVKEMRSELERLKHEPDAVFFNTWVQARAQAF